MPLYTKFFGIEKIGGVNLIVSQILNHWFLFQTSFRKKRIGRFFRSSPSPNCRIIMLRILSAVLRQSILVERTNVLAGALRIECVELSRNRSMGIEWFLCCQMRGE